MISRTVGQTATATQVITNRVMLEKVEVAQSSAVAPRLFLQIFNVKVPTVGVTTPEMVLPIPAGRTLGCAQNRRHYDMTGDLGGCDFSTGLSYAVTTTPGGSTNPTAGDEPLVKIKYELVG